jgi:PAS domain S-box-containing protein
MEKSTSKNLSRSTALIDLSPAGLFTIEKSGAICEVNLAGARLLGIDRAQLVGQNFATFIPIAERPAFNALLSQVFASTTPKSCELTLLNPNQSTGNIAFDAILSPDTPHCYLMVRDMTAAKQTASTLAESEARTSAIIESAMDAIITVDDAMRIVVFNQAAVAMFGCSAIEAIGHSLDRFIPQHYRTRHQEHIQTFGESGTTSRSMGKPGQVDAVRANGEEFPVEAAISHAAVFGRQFYTVILRDVTQSNLARTRLEQTQRELRALSKAANSALEAERTRIAREMHDEFGQSLTAMKMDIESMRQGLRTDQPDLQAHALAIRTSIDSLVTATRRLAFDLRPLMLDDLGLIAALEWLAKTFSERVGIDVKLTVDDPQAQITEPFASALYRTAQESLTNIARHAQASSVVMHLEHDEEYLQLTVHDNGRGIELTEMSKRGSYGLMGIRERMHLMGGTLEVSRHPTQGTQLRVRVPLTNPSDNSQY